MWDKSEKGGIQKWLSYSANKNKELLDKETDDDRFVKLKARIDKKNWIFK